MLRDEVVRANQLQSTSHFGKLKSVKRVAINIKKETVVWGVISRGQGISDSKPLTVVMQSGARGCPMHRAIETIFQLGGKSTCIRRGRW